MFETSETCDPTMFEVLLSAIFSRESESGPTPCEAPDGLTTSACGLEAHLAKDSAPPVSSEASTISVTFGPPSIDWSTMCDLPSCSENKLPRRSSLDPLEVRLASMDLTASMGAIAKRETRNAEAWIDLVQADLEGSGYAVGIQATPAACVGAPHIRLRTYFVGHALGLADMHGDGWPEKRERIAQAGYDGSKRDCPSSRLVDRVGARLEGQRRHGDGGRGRQVSTGPIAPSSEPRSISPRTTRGEPERRPGPTNGFWGDADWLRCRDGKWRPTLAGSFPLVDGSAFRVDSGGPFAGRSRKEMLKGAGNAIVAEHAAAFIQTYMEARDQLVRGGRIGNRPFRNIEDDI